MDRSIFNQFIKLENNNFKQFYFENSIYFETDLLFKTKMIDLLMNEDYKDLFFKFESKRSSGTDDHTDPKYNDRYELSIIVTDNEDFEIGYKSNLSYFSLRHMNSPDFPFEIFFNRAEELEYKLKDYLRQQFVEKLDKKIPNKPEKHKKVKL